MPADVDRDLELGLLRDGTVGAAAIAKAKDRGQKTQCSLEEALLDSAACTERDILRALARTYHMQYLMSEKAAQLKVADEVLERLPVRTAEALRVVPFRFDETNALWLLADSPISEEVVSTLLKSTGARAVNRLLVRRNVLWAATRYFYYRDFDAFAHPGPPPAPPDRPEREDPFDQSDIVRLSETLRCPGCGAPASLDMFQCRACGLLLNAEASAVHRGLMENSIVRALLAPPDSNPRPRGGSGEKTLRVDTSVDASVVPVLIAGVDIFETPLNEFEAYVATFLDGDANVSAVARAAQLPEIEVHAVVRSLAQRKIVELTRKSSPAEEPAPDREPARRAAPERAAPAPPPPPARKPPPSGHDYILQRAIKLERHGRIEEAISVLESGIGLLPHPAPLYNRLALVLLDQRRDLARAEGLLRKAVEIDPANDVYSKNLYKVLGLAAVSALAIEERKKK